MKTKLLLCTGMLASGLLLGTGAFGADWPQFGYDATHSGNNTAETTITAANVSQLTSLYANPVTLSSSVDSAPVYVSNVATPGGTKNLLFFLSQNGKIMAIDAATGSEVWSHQTSGNQPTTSSPAIDPNRLYVYSYGTDGNAHKYQVGNGTEITGSGWPQTITLKTGVEKGASGLTIANDNGTNYLIVVTNGYIGDGGDYQGHLVSINLSNGAQNVFNVMCSYLTTHLVSNGTPGVDDCNYADDPPVFRRGQQGGIWGRGGATFDAVTGRVYIATGNGDFTANAGGFDWGDSVLALNVDGTGNGGGIPRDSYTPTNYQDLYDGDTDLGSISLAILPAPAASTVQHLGMQVGKDAVMRLINLDNMSGAHAPAHVGGELQLLNVQQGGGGMREQPAVWVNPADGSTWLFIGNGNGISAVQLGLDGSNRPMLSYRWNNGDASTSAIVANGVLYYASLGGNIVARNPLTGNVLWTSPSNGGVHWQSPILVNGALYLIDNSAQLWKFGLNQPDLIFKDGFDGP